MTKLVKLMNKKIQVAVSWVVTPCNDVVGPHAVSIFTLMMEASWSFETFSLYHITT